MPLRVDHLKVLVIAPVGRDASLLCDALAGAGILADDERTVENAISILEKQSVGALLITEEMLNPETIDLLSIQLSLQPSWSDLPVLILTVGGSATTLSRKREQDRLPLGSITLLERPIRIATLISSVRSALRSRNRQYQVRDTLIERDLAEAARRDSESKLLLAIETARLGAWELNIATDALDASATCRQHFDWDADVLLSRTDAMDRLHPEDRPEVAKRLAATVQTGLPYAAEFRVVWKDGSVHWISASGRLLESDKGRSGAAPDRNHPVRIAGVTLDITERVLSEAALRNADKLALVGRLSSSIAHEINNPLEAVTNLLYLLDKSELGGTEKEYVNLAQRELARVSDITAQTLTFNRQQNTHEHAVLTVILDSVIALYQGRLTTSNIQVIRDYTYQRPIFCYPGELRQVFTNLIANAFDATRRGGRIILRERRACHAATGRQGVQITIADTGSGMSSEVKKRIFEAFYSTKGNNGTGLGLWISRGIVEKHKGVLRFSTSTSEAHHGTVFTIFLPVET